MSEKFYTFTEGVMWENNPWIITIDTVCDSFGGKPCRHCHSHKTITHTRYDRRTYTTEEWICPRVITVHNEGGCNSTGLCLDCVLEAVKELT